MTEEDKLLLEYIQDEVEKYVIEIVEEHANKLHESLITFGYTEELVVTLVYSGTKDNMVSPIFPR